MVAINVKVIYCFEVIFLKRFLQRVGLAFFCNQIFLFTPREKILGKGHFGHPQRNIDLYVFRYEFLVKKMIFDMRGVFNFFQARTDTKKSYRYKTEYEHKFITVQFIID